MCLPFVLTIRLETTSPLQPDDIASKIRAVMHVDVTGHTNHNFLCGGKATRSYNDHQVRDIHK